MSKTEEFLTQKEEESIVEAIAKAEKNTSGEIRVHLEEKSEKLPLERAKEIFIALRMHATKARNGVLIYICVTQKKIAIIGDEGINNKVPNNFWDSTKNDIISHFKQKAFATGLIKGIENVGLQLKEYFPYTDDDVNELSNEISKG